jgi:hypothetical protein
LVERVHQNPHLVVVEGGGKRVLCQKLEHGPPRSRYLRTYSWLKDNDNCVAA